MRLRLIIVAAVTFAIGALAALLVLNMTEQRGARVQVAGKALVGGAFALTDHTGKRVTDKDLRGRYLLVFFGFTNCPDVCPTGLQTVSAALDALGGKAEKVTPVFITVDPNRDTPGQLAGYVSNFHPRLIGLTGSEEEIAAAAKAYRVYYKQVKDEGSTAGYTMDHTSIIYLMGPDGAYLSHFAHGADPDEMAARIAKYL